VSDAIDAIVIGAGLSGLVAAAYLAKAGKRTVVLEAGSSVGGSCETVPLGKGFEAPLALHSFHALDPRVMRELGVARHGLQYAVRDMPMVGLRSDGRHVVIARERRATMRQLALHARADAENWPRYRRELFAFGWTMRARWWERATTAKQAPESLDRLSRQGAGAFLDSWFESDALKATLAFDASAMSPLAPGSALLLAWHASQEMCGVQDAVASVRGGPGALARAFEAAAETAGARIGTGDRVTEIVTENGKALGVRVACGRPVMAPLVFSTLSRRATLACLARGERLGLEEWDDLQSAKPEIASANLVFGLSALPAFGGIAVPATGRFILAENLETYESAHAAARAGRLPDEPTLEFVIPTVSDPQLAPMGQHVLSVRVQPVPALPEGGWLGAKEDFAARIVTLLERAMPGFARAVLAMEMLTPDQSVKRHGDRCSHDGLLERLLADWPARIETAIGGLFLCGRDAEPVPAVSGRAARIAVRLALGAEQRP
jgi:phytoene dehydrogenase-like protein